MDDRPRSVIHDSNFLHINWKAEQYRPSRGEGFPMPTQRKPKNKNRLRGARVRGRVYPLPPPRHSSAVCACSLDSGTQGRGPCRPIGLGGPLSKATPLHYPILHYTAGTTLHYTTARHATPSGPQRAYRFPQHSATCMHIRMTRLSWTQFGAFAQGQTIKREDIMTS